MREIKFRAWDKHDRVMTGPFDMVALNSDRNHVWVLEQEWLQYTGLKDKNGVEIYEGDIVSYPESEFVNKGDRAFDEKPWTVGWDSKLGTYLLIGKDSIDMLYEVGADILEVIGNIYENPELLK